MLRQTRASEAAASTTAAPGLQRQRNGKSRRGDQQDVAPEEQLLLPISDVVLLRSTTNPIDDCKTPEGFERLPDDLNYGTGGRFVCVHACWLRGMMCPPARLVAVVGGPRHSRHAGPHSLARSRGIRLKHQFSHTIYNERKHSAFAICENKKNKRSAQEHL